MPKQFDNSQIIDQIYTSLQTIFLASIRKCLQNYTSLKGLKSFIGRAISQRLTVNVIT